MRQKLIWMTILTLILVLTNSCTMTTIKTPQDYTIRYGQLFQHKKLSYTTDPTGKTIFTYSTQPKGQEQMVQAIITAYQAGQTIGGL